MSESTDGVLTRGDWRVEFDDLGGCECRSSAYIIRSASGERIAVVDVDDYVFATGDDDERWEMRHGRHPKAEANANLFAGAAAMYEALKAIVADDDATRDWNRRVLLNGLRHQMDPVPGEIRARIDAAIARAEGRGA